MSFVRDRLQRRLARPAASLALVLAAFATLGFPGCPSELSSTGTENPNSMSMDHLWPNDDQRYWSYLGSTVQLPPEQMDPLPPGATPQRVTPDHAQQLLQDELTPIGGSFPYMFVLHFDGEITTQSGVLAQNLVESIFGIRGPAIATPPSGSFERRWLGRLAKVRPDLRARLAALAPARAGSSAAGGFEAYPQLIHGYAYSKGPSYVGTFGDADTLLAWQFLDSSTRVGHEFDFQLVPSLADDVWLRALIERQVSVDLPDGSSVVGLDVIYVIDYGVVEVTDDSGNPTGLQRWFDYGRVTYVPGVGPVKDFERQGAVATSGMTHGQYEIRLDLKETGITPVLAARQARVEK